MNSIESLLLIADGLLIWILVMLWTIKDEIKKLNNRNNNSNSV